MNTDKITVAGLLLVILAIILLGFIIMQHSFPVSKYLAQSPYYIDTNQNVGAQDSEFLWTNRYVDLMAQAFMFFTAAAGCIAMLKKEIRGKHS
jgi:multisubunit Na+/H+ antiporter MnhB subunit